MDIKAEIDRLRALPRNKLSKLVRDLLSDNENASAQVHKIDESIAQMRAKRAELVGICDYTMTKALDVQRNEASKTKAGKADAQSEKTAPAP